LFQNPVGVAAKQPMSQVLGKSGGIAAFSTKFKAAVPKLRFLVALLLIYLFESSYPVKIYIHSWTSFVFNTANTETIPVW
jgi:hypothetical protein